MKRRIWLLGAMGLVLFLTVPLVWALDVEPKQVNIETKFSEVNLDNFQRPLLGRFQSYFNLYGGITWHRDQTMFDSDLSERLSVAVPPNPELKFSLSEEKKVRDRWHQWNTGGELGFGLTDKITVRAWGNFYLPAASRPSVNRQLDETVSVSLGGVPVISDFFKLNYFDENFHRWRKSESFGAEVNYRPLPNLEFYAVTNGNASWFREDISYRFDDNIVRDKILVRERSFNQELLGGFKYIFDMPATDPKIAAMDLRRSPSPNVVDLAQWDRALLHMGEFMVNPYGGVRFIDRRLTFFQRFGGELMTDFDVQLDETRNRPIWTHDETARDVYAQGIIGANAAVGITDCFLLEGGYRHYLPVTYKRFVTRKFGNGVHFFDEDDHGQNEGWAGNAKFTYRFNPWFQAYTGYSGWADHSQFMEDILYFNDFGSMFAEKGEFDRRLAEHRVYGGFTFLTPVRGEANPAPTAKRTLSDWQRPLLRPWQLGANIYGGWRYIKDVFIKDFDNRFVGSLSSFRARTEIDRSFSQGFMGADIYFGILKNLQFDLSGHYYAPARYANRTSSGLFMLDSGGGVYTRFSGEESSWDVSPRFIYRPWPNFEAFLGAGFGQVRTVRNQEQKIKTEIFPLSLRLGATQEFTKMETIYNVNAGIKILF